MRHRPLGRTDILVSEVCFTLPAVGDFDPPESVGESARLVEKALDAGINFFAAEGEAEVHLGRALGARRKDVVISVGSTVPDGVDRDRLRARALVHACIDASLVRLGTDYIDLYHPRGWASSLSETLGALDEAVRAGKVRCLGCEGSGTEFLKEALRMSQCRGWSRFESLALAYGINYRGAERDEVPLLVEHGMGLLVKPPPVHLRVRRSGHYEFHTPAVAVPPGVAPGADPGLVHVAWVLAQPFVSAVIAPGYSDRQLDFAVEATKLVLSEEELKLLDRASAGR